MMVNRSVSNCSSPSGRRRGENDNWFKTADEDAVLNQLSYECSTVVRVRLYRLFERPAGLFVGFFDAQANFTGRCTSSPRAKMADLYIFHLVHSPKLVVVITLLLVDSSNG